MSISERLGYGEQRVNEVLFDTLSQLVKREVKPGDRLPAVVSADIPLAGFDPDHPITQGLWIPAGSSVMAKIAMPADFRFDILRKSGLFHEYPIARSRMMQQSLEAAVAGRVGDYVGFNNYGGRPIVTSPGAKLFYYLYRDIELTTIQDKELTDAIGTSDGYPIQVYGKEKEDWRIWHPDGDENKAIGIKLRVVDRTKASYIPFSNKPIYIFDKDAPKHGREYADANLVSPIPDPEEYTDALFWVSESSSPLKLNGNFHGLVQHPRHLNAPLLQKDKTPGYPIRFEFHSKITRGQMARWVGIKFLQG